ncbi:MAG TPA: MipA/OmpV family protein [Xanthobacteraceae bacterium]|jgi:outer membrane protein
MTGWRFALAGIVVLAPAVAAAGDLSPAQPSLSAPANYASASPDWIVTIGAEGRLVPAWPGARTDEYAFAGLPLFSIRQAGTPPDYFGPRDSFGFPILNLGQIKIGPAFKIVGERKTSDYAELNGLNDVDYALQAGGFIDFWPVQWLRLRTEVRQGFGGETGVTGDAFLDAVVPLGQFRVSAGPRIELQSTKAISPYFNITAAQATAANLAQPGLAPLTAFAAGGGLYSYGAGGEVEYFFNQQWSAHAFAEYDRLTGDAANSPLVAMRGSPNQLTFGFGATYSFSMHPLW